MAWSARSLDLMFDLFIMLKKWPLILNLSTLKVKNKENKKIKGLKRDDEDEDEEEERIKPASTLEGVRDLADGDVMAVGVVDGDLSKVLDRIKANALEINIGDASLWLLDVGQLLCDEVLGLVQKVRHLGIRYVLRRDDRGIREIEKMK